MKPTMMQTYTGKVIDLEDFRPKDVRLPDISHALALTNRFTGHTIVPYSVAQHCVEVSHSCPPEHALWGLMHDASEAYLGDVARPLKAMLPNYKELERHVQQTIATVYRLPWPMPDCIHEADNRCLMAEKRDLLLVQHDWDIDAEPVPHRIEPMGWFTAKQAFEERFKELHRR